MITSITFKLEDNEKDKIKACASREDLTVSQYIRRAIKYYIQEVEENGST